MGRVPGVVRGAAARAAAGHRSAPGLAEELPAHLIVFDVLQLGGEELLHIPYAERRARLEQLLTEHALHAPWALCPETDDPATAQEWLTSWTPAPGVEGLVIRGTEQHYLRGARALYKVRRRETTEAVIGAVTGPLERPQTHILGRYDEAGTLRPVGRSTPLRPDCGARAERLVPAGPGHPWEGHPLHVVGGGEDAADRPPLRTGRSLGRGPAAATGACRGGSRCARGRRVPAL
ncbi:hypothetical protein [Streptomyces sp. NPDC014006]|uniref:ATP-dependent DNA ligase n=1 Tax=Streptomyces sp. NPDC014006 TaxID=3364870 RepID=UPI0036FD531D